MPTTGLPRLTPKTNGRRLKRLKNKVLVEFQRRHGIKGRFDQSPIDGCREILLFKAFHHFWNKWLAANAGTTHAVVVKPEVRVIFREVFNV